MSAESSRSSRPPQTDSAPGGREAEAAESVSRESDKLAELPTPEERVREFLDEFGEDAHVALSESHGRALRAECVEEEFNEFTVYTDEGEEVHRENLVSRESVPLWQGVANMLEWHRDYHKSTLRLEYGRESDPTHTLLDVDLENSWFATYQDAERAKLKALERETCGYETCEECDTRYCSEPDGHETEWVSGGFEEPVVVLTGRTASGAGRPPVDHARSIADAWSNGDVRRSLRYILDERLGLESGEWARWTQGEPHPGDGENRGYHHAHDIIILDGAAADEEVTAATFRTMIERHVEACEYAGPEAHDMDVGIEEWESGDVETVSVKSVDGEIRESVASYAAAYLANESVDLLERDVEYLAWAATMWATETQKGIKSDSANWAIKADRCRHKHHEGEQEVAHGEDVTRKNCRCAEAPWGPGCSRCDGRGFHVVCRQCRSPWEVEQRETLVEAKRVAGPGEPSVEVVADGGATAETETAEQAREEGMRERWPSARDAAVVGGPTRERECGHEEPDTCPLCATETEAPHHTVSGEVPIPEDAEAPGAESVSASFIRPPSWSAKSILRDGEEIPATGGTSDKRPLVLPSAPSAVVSMASRSGGVATCQCCGSWLEGPSEVVGHTCEADVYVWWRPATEPPAAETVLSYEEFLEAAPEHLLGGDDLDAEAGDVLDAEPQLGEEVRRYIEFNEVSVAEVLGRFSLPPERRGEVEELVGEN